MSPDPIVYPAPLASVSAACFERTLDGASVVSASSALTEFGTRLSEDNPTGGTHGINKPSESSERELKKWFIIISNPNGSVMNRPLSSKGCKMGCKMQDMFQ